MGDTPLRAVVIGAGFAGEGHTIALRHVGVEVVAMCARQPDIVRRMADKLNIEIASTDWRAVLESVQPDIVAIGTPATLRREVIERSVALGCHLYCDKPLALDAHEASELYHMVKAAGVKHAYASTHCYDPSVAYLAELVRDNVIGRLKEAVFTICHHSGPVKPWSWFLVRALGGGLLNNVFVHHLGILERIFGGPLIRVMGETRNPAECAPVIPGIHDFRDWVARARALTPEEIADAEWRACDFEGGYSALMRFAAPSGELPVTLAYGGSVTPPTQDTSQLRLYGDEGTLIAHGEMAFKVRHIAVKGQAVIEELPVPERLLADLPQTGGYCEDRWAALARDFVADIRGEAHRPYLTFRDGWRYQEAIDAIYAGRGLYAIPVPAL